MSDDRPRAVFDCSVLARALINPRGPAGACVLQVQRGTITLILSDYVLQETRELSRKIKASRGVTAEQIETLIRDLSTNAELWEDVPNVFGHPLDPDDSHYVDLACVSRATHLLSNDSHFLSLRDVGAISWTEFQKLPTRPSVMTPEEFLATLRTQEEPSK